MIFNHIVQNSIRIALWKDYYMNVYGSDAFDVTLGDYGLDHVGHCLDGIRESIMCASDISVIVWQWHAPAQRVAGHSDIVHSCRNFEKIRQWSADHRAIKDLDRTVYAEDDIVIPEF